MEFLHTTGKMKIGAITLENSVVKFNKAEHTHILWPTNSVQSTYSTEMWTYLPPKNLYKNIQSNIILYNLKL